MARSRNAKRPAPVERMDLDDSDADVRVNGPERPPQRSRASPSPASERSDYASESEDTRTESTKALAAKLVRYALSCEYSRTPIKKEGFRKDVVLTARQFKEVFLEAQIMLQSVFGMKMEELPVRDKLTNAQKRAAAKSEKQNTSTNSWVLVSTLPAQYRDSKIIPPPKIPNSTEEAQYVGLYTFFIALIYMHQDRLPESKLDMQLRKLNLETYTPLGTTDKLFKRMEKDGYIVKFKDSSSGEELVEYLVGPRGKVEVDREAAANFIRTIYGSDVAEDFDRRLEKSLRVNAPPPTQRSGDAVSSTAGPSGSWRRDRRTAASESDGDDSDMDDED